MLNLPAKWARSPSRRIRFFPSRRHAPSAGFVQTIRCGSRMRGKASSPMPVIRTANPRPRPPIRTVSPIKQLFQTGEAWWRYFKKHEDEIRPAVVDNVVRMLACGLEVMGYASHCCSNGTARHRKKVCFSCKSRFCPTCGKKATDQWIATQRATLPRTRWQHITLTMPSALWESFRLNRSLSEGAEPLGCGHRKKTAQRKGSCPASLRRYIRLAAISNGMYISI